MPFTGAGKQGRTYCFSLDNNSAAATAHVILTGSHGTRVFACPSQEQVSRGRTYCFLLTTFRQQAQRRLFHRQPQHACLRVPFTGAGEQGRTCCFNSSTFRQQPQRTSFSPAATARVSSRALLRESSRAGANPVRWNGSHGAFGTHDDATTRRSSCCGTACLQSCARYPNVSPALVLM